MAAENASTTNYIRFVDCCDGTEIKFKGAIGLTDEAVYSYIGLSAFIGFGGSLVPGRCYTVYFEYTSIIPIPYPSAPNSSLFLAQVDCNGPSCLPCPEPSCECPEGFALIDGDCVNVQYTLAQYSEPTLELVAGAKNCGYGAGGALLYEDITAKPKPIYGTGASSATYSVKDNGGAGANVTVWNPNTVSTYIPWSFTSPGIVNTLWGSSQGAGAGCASSPISVQPCPTGNTAGRLNTVGIWAPGIANNVELSFEYCITIDTTKQYLVALAGDNYVKFYVDSTLYVELNDATATGLTPFNYWHVFPVTLSAGTHIIKISGVNVGGPATVGGEIYDISESQFRSVLGIRATGPGNCGNVISDLNPYLIFSTQNLIGWQVADPDNPGTWSCPSGSGGVLDFCNGVAQCKIENSFPLICDCYMLIPCDGSNPIIANNLELADYVNGFISITAESYEGCVYVTQLSENQCINLETITIDPRVGCDCFLNCYFVTGTNGFIYVDANNVLQEVSALEASPYVKICSKVEPVPENTSLDFNIVNLGLCEGGECPISCYKLTNCDDATDVIYTNSDTVLPYLYGPDSIVRILNRSGCYTVSELAEGEICDCPISVTVTASFSSCVACTGYRAYRLTSCETGDVIFSVDDLEEYIDKTVQTDCGCYLVTLINYLPPSPQSVTVEYVFDNCDRCLATYYQLRDCSTNEIEVYTLTNLSSLVGEVVKIEGCDACLKVEETREPGITRNVNVTDTYALCQECIKADQKCKCQSAVNDNLETTLQLRYIDCNGDQAFTDFIAPGKRSDKHCVLEWITGEDIIDNGECSSSTASCHTYIITVPPFLDLSGGTLFYKDCNGDEVFQEFPQGKFPLIYNICGVIGQTSQDIYTEGNAEYPVTWIETSNSCGESFTCPPIVYPKRPVIPGYTTPGCDTERFEKITCKSSEILYKTVMQKRYGISNCCPDEDDKWLIKKELVDLQGALDPNYVCLPVQSCCTGASNCGCGCNNQLKTCNS
jgi:hypothetical protein